MTRYKIPDSLGQMAKDRADAATAAGKSSVPWEDQGRDFDQEALEELADALNYMTWALIKSEQGGADYAELRTRSVAIKRLRATFEELASAMRLHGHDGRLNLPPAESRGVADPAPGGPEDPGGGAS